MSLYYVYIGRDAQDKKTILPFAATLVLISNLLRQYSFEL